MFYINDTYLYGRTKRGDLRQKGFFTQITGIFQLQFVRQRVLSII